MYKKCKMQKNKDEDNEKKLITDEQNVIKWINMNFKF